MPLVPYKKIARKFFYIWLLVFLAFGVFALEDTAPPLIAFPGDNAITGEIFTPKEIYLIPQTVFIGDKGRIVATLGPAFNSVEPFILHSPSEFPVVTDLKISRIELEKRNNNVRLLIDFSAYAPGLFGFPLFYFRTYDKEPLILGGLEINVASILTPELMVLSDPAFPLAVPGTGFLIYGGVGVILLILILGIGIFFWIPRYLEPLRKKLRQRKLLITLEQRLKLLKAIQNDPLRLKEHFSLLAMEFREFLSYLTGSNCQVLTPIEFLDLPVPVPGSHGPDYLYKLFRRLDELRFSRHPIVQVDVFDITDEFGNFLTSVRNKEKIT